MRWADEVALPQQQQTALGWAGVRWAERLGIDTCACTSITRARLLRELYGHCVEVLSGRGCQASCPSAPAPGIVATRGCLRCPCPECDTAPLTRLTPCGRSAALLPTMVRKAGRGAWECAAQAEESTC